MRCCFPPCRRREAGRRIQCTNNLRQIGIALANYHDIHSALPLGRVWGPLPGNPFPGFFSGTQNTPWFCLMLPQLGEGPRYNAYNFDIGAEGPLSGGYPSGWSINQTVTLAKLGLFQCPSDLDRPFEIDNLPGRGTVTSTRGNYVASWGNTDWSQRNQVTGTATMNLPVQFLPSAFGHTSVGLRQLTDGTSNTVVLSEVLQGSQGDSRGLPWTASAVFMTRFTPNGLADYYGVAATAAIPGDRTGTGCVSEPALGLPCVSVAFPWLDAFQAARSRHPGGVNALLGDSSARFVKSTINPRTWVQINSISGGEVVGADGF